MPTAFKGSESDLKDVVGWSKYWQPVETAGEDAVRFFTWPPYVVDQRQFSSSTGHKVNGKGFSRYRNIDDENEIGTRGTAGVVFDQ